MFCLRLPRPLRVLTASSIVCSCFLVTSAVFAQPEPPADAVKDEPTKPADSSKPDTAKADTPKADTPKTNTVKADSAKSIAAKSEMTVEAVAARARESVVVVSFAGRDGKQKGLGAGFIVSPDGLIATNLHVIGEARPVSVTLANGDVYDVKTIHATQRSMDLAVLKIDAKNLTALELGDSEALKQGQPVVAIGHPERQKYSVVSGVVSRTEIIDGKPMIQVAIPIERGNSGGPLLDLSGRVQGLLTMKSLVTQNLGFAVAVNSLKPLLAKPNPVPMNRWLTIGALDPKKWQPLFGSRWRQRAGRILVSGDGAGIGRRSLCLSQTPPPDSPFELEVTLRLEDEEGAAGLVFHSDGNNNHYGFYPTGGQLRLSRFDGPDVFAWQPMTTVPSKHYRPGDWNTIKVRIDGDTIQCFVNGERVIEMADSRYNTGQVGLAQFRGTSAEFKSFRVGTELPSLLPDGDQVMRITDIVADISPDTPPVDALITKLVPEDSRGLTVLRDRARLLEQQAERLRQLAKRVHERSVQAKLAELMQADEAKIDLLHAALLIAVLDNEEIDATAYVAEVDRMVDEIKDSLANEATQAEKLAALDKYLFEEMGFHGSRTDYYNRSNSYLNEAIDDREGLPITLSVLYIEMARRLGLKVVGVGLPGHFVVRFEPADGPTQLIDVFEQGSRLSLEDAGKQVLSRTGRSITDDDLKASSKRAILIRMLHNLNGLAAEASDGEAMLGYVNTILTLDPNAEEPTTGRDRWMRAQLNYFTGRKEQAAGDIEWLIEHQPAGVQQFEVERLQRALQGGE